MDFLTGPGYNEQNAAPVFPAGGQNQTDILRARYLTRKPWERAASTPKSMGAKFSLETAEPSALEKERDRSASPPARASASARQTSVSGARGSD